jgi:hypothetical protein
MSAEAWLTLSVCVVGALVGGLIFLAVQYGHIVDPIEEEGPQ